MAKSWEDIRKKLEKIEDWQERGLDELLREAQKVYVRREEETEKRQTRLLVAAVREGQKGVIMRPGRSGRGDKAVECFYCRKRGHMKRECRKRIQDEKAFRED